MRNPMNHSPEYRRRRFANWFPLGLTYATYYMGRYNLNVSSTTMMEKFSLSKADFGMIATAGFWTYALAVMFNGPLADRIGGKGRAGDELSRFAERQRFDLKLGAVAVGVGIIKRQCQAMMHRPNRHQSPRSA
jgi:MFS family permease